MLILQKTIKDNLGLIFGNEENKKNYSKFEERTPNKWNCVLNFVLIN